MSRDAGERHAGVDELLETKLLVITLTAGEIAGTAKVIEKYADTPAMKTSAQALAANTETLRDAVREITDHLFSEPRPSAPYRRPQVIVDAWRVLRLGGFDFDDSKRKLLDEYLLGGAVK